MTASPFVHLKVHSAYSLLEGALPIAKLAKLATAFGMPALGLTDTNNMFGALEFSDKLAKDGIQPIAGVCVDVDFADATSSRGNGRTMGPTALRPSGRMALFAANEAGYANLMKISSACHLDVNDTEPPHVDMTHFERWSQGVIALTGGPDGPIDRALGDDDSALATSRLGRLKAIFGNRLYVEVQRHGTTAEAAIEPALLSLAYELELPIVATNECYFATPDDHEAHDVLLCIAQGKYITEDDRRRVTRQHYFKSADEMVALFADLPEATANTIEIAIRCAFRPKGRKPILPSFVATAPGATEEQRLAAEAAELKRQAEEGLTLRLATHPLADGFTREGGRTQWRALRLHAALEGAGRLSGTAGRGRSHGG